jgi:hypothetical protein
VVRAIDRHVENIYSELDAQEKRIQEVRAELASLRQAAHASLQSPTRATGARLIV